VSLTTHLKLTQLRWIYVSCITMLLEQPKDGRYAKNAGAVFNLSYHIVWCPKYRRKVLVGDVEQRRKHILSSYAGTVGQVSDATVQKYIANQKGR